jgi:tripartite-type tricarboxylate transporter receptor subunit TctC
VPTLAEKGFGGTEVNIWMGFFMPAATPQPIVQKFTNAVAEASRKPALKAAIEKTGMIQDYGDPTRIVELLQREHANISKLAQVVDLGM